MPRAVQAARTRDPDGIRAAIERFLASCRRPALHEPGEHPFALEADRYAIALRGGRLLIEVWDERRNLARRVVGIEEERPGRMRVLVERFGGKTGHMLLVDEARPHDDVSRHTTRLIFRERFRRLLAREYPGWTVAELSAEPDLEHSLSPACPRALIRRGGVAWAAIGADPASADPSSALSLGLIWLDYVRRRDPRLAVEGLALFLPLDRHQNTCLRLRYLNSAAARWAVFVYSPENYCERLDERDWGNLDTRLEPRGDLRPLHSEWLEIVERVTAIEGVEAIEPGNGTLSLRVRGLEFAALAGGRMHFGLHGKREASPAHAAEIVGLAEELAHLRSADSAGRDQPLAKLNPEAWLESQVRAHLKEIDAELLAAPVYGQVPAFAGIDRGVIDLLAVSCAGRLAVIEIKAAEDLHLPLQALDYWMRVAWHAERDEFSVGGYFPGVAVCRERPRLLLIAPALHWHPTTETILRYLSPEVDVERFGVGLEWQRQLKVMFRARGWQRPG